MKLALARLGLWLFVSIVLFETLLGAFDHGARWTACASLAGAVGFLFVAYKRVLAHFRATAPSQQRG